MIANLLKSLFKKSTQATFNPDEWVIPNDVEKSLRESYLSEVQQLSELPNKILLLRAVTAACSSTPLIEHHAEIQRHTGHGEQEFQNYLKTIKTLSYTEGQTLEEFIKEHKKPDLPDQEISL